MASLTYPNRQGGSAARRNTAPGMASTSARNSVPRSPCIIASARWPSGFGCRAAEHGTTRLPRGAASAWTDCGHRHPTTRAEKLARRTDRARGPRRWHDVSACRARRAVRGAGPMLVSRPYRVYSPLPGPSSVRVTSRAALSTTHSRVWETGRPSGPPVVHRGRGDSGGARGTRALGALRSHAGHCAPAKPSRTLVACS